MSNDLEDHSHSASEPIDPGGESAAPEHGQFLASAASPAAQTQSPPPQKAPDERPFDGYSPAQRKFHWIVAGLVFVQLALGLRIGTLPKHDIPGGVMTLHLIVGSLIFVVVLMRRRLRSRLGAPPPPAGTPIEAASLARANHQGFYILLLALPVFGWLAYGSRSPDGSGFGAIHAALALTLVLAICAHLLGVFYHTYFRRDGLLKRMTG